MVIFYSQHIRLLRTDFHHHTTTSGVLFLLLIRLAFPTLPDNDLFAITCMSAARMNYNARCLNLEYRDQQLVPSSDQELVTINKQ